MSNPETITIDDVKYVREDSVSELKSDVNGLPYCIVRCDRSGVYAGFVSKDNGQTVEILRARKLWYWSGAASLSQLAVDGVSDPDGCKFPCELDSVSVRDCIEIIPATSKCYDSISSVSVWRA